MEDYKSQLLNKIKTNLSNAFLPTELNIVTDVIVDILNEYEITPLSTEIAICDDTNDKILKLYSSCLYVDGLSVKTINAYINEVKGFLKFINKNYNEIVEYDIRYYLGVEKKRGLQNTSLENKRSYLAAFFKWLTISKHINYNPCEIIKPIKLPKKVRQPFSNTELEEIKSACTSIKERAIVELLFSSGIRVSELSNLNISDVDFNNNSVFVKDGKGGKDRITYMTDVSAMYLKRYITERKDTNPALFLSRKGRLTTSGVEYILHNIGDRVGIFDCHPHRFRRTLATLIVDKGANIQEAQILLGHSNVNTTLTYIYTNNEKINSAYKKAM